MNLFEEPVDQNETSEREELLNKWKDKSKEELLEAKINSDLFVKTLTKRQDDISKDYLEAKKQLDAQASLQELVDRLNKAGPSNSEHTPANEVIESRPEPIDIDKKITEAIAKTRREERQAANAKLVQDKLRERFGNSYQAVLRETGLPDEKIQEIAMESPDAIFRLVGLNNEMKENFQTPPRSAQRNDNFAPRASNKRDWAYYQELKKSNPKLYLDPKIAVQMHNDVIEIGEEAFYGRN